MACVSQLACRVPENLTMALMSWYEWGPQICVLTSLPRDSDDAKFYEPLLSRWWGQGMHVVTLNWYYMLYVWPTKCYTQMFKQVHTEDSGERRKCI